MNMKETNFAHKVCLHLNETLDVISPDMNKRLDQARHIALSQQKKESPLTVQVLKEAGIGLSTYRSSMIDKVGMTIVSLLLIAFLMGFFHYEEQRHIQKMANLDVAVLTDELPPKAYTDSGFCAYLERNGV